MNTPSSTTRWRNAPRMPESYKDIARLVRLAREARLEPVDFDWYFSEESLRRLQRAVYERGRAYTGRFRLFDARILAAIREALDDTNTVLILSEPQTATLDAQVQCERVEGLFRLHGHAPFVFVFGYGWLAASDRGETLGPTGRSALFEAVGSPLLQEAQGRVAAQLSGPGSQGAGAYPLR
jgi:hypothetical protein